MERLRGQASEPGRARQVVTEIHVRMSSFVARVELLSKLTQRSEIDNGRICRFWFAGVAFRYVALVRVTTIAPKPLLVVLAVMECRIGPFVTEFDLLPLGTCVAWDPT